MRQPCQVSPGKQKTHGPVTHFPTNLEPNTPAWYIICHMAFSQPSKCLTASAQGAKRAVHSAASPVCWPTTTEEGRSYQESEWHTQATRADMAASFVKLCRMSAGAAHQPRQPRQHHSPRGHVRLWKLETPRFSSAWMDGLDALHSYAGRIPSGRLFSYVSCRTTPTALPPCFLILSSPTFL